MHPNEELISRFYTAFAAGDHETMAASYTDDASFSDPVFPHLSADEVGAMWRMFCTSGNELGWTPFVKGQVRKQAASQLLHFQAQN